MADPARIAAVEKGRKLFAELKSSIGRLKAQVTTPHFGNCLVLALIGFTVLLAAAPPSNLPSLWLIKHGRSQFSSVLSFFFPDDKSHRQSRPAEELMGCDFFDGDWVEDEHYPVYEPGSCPIVDEEFDCLLNGRPDKDYQKFRWKPKGCSLRRFNGTHMLELLRGKRLVFVGDSLNRNMWESLVCILRGSAANQSQVFEANGWTYFRGAGPFSFLFKDYNCSIEFFTCPFLVEQRAVLEGGRTKQMLRLDLMDNFSEMYKGADIIVFNTGHWWNHEKTLSATFQEGGHVYQELDVLEAFRKALTTWARWVDGNVNPNTSLVFFRGYSATHFRDSKPNYRGHCDEETAPNNNETLPDQYVPLMKVLETVISRMRTPITYLNITKMTWYRKDGHPSMYRRRLNLSDEFDTRRFLKAQDCSHWCLPGVPDSWNEILYAELLVKLPRSMK